MALLPPLVAVQYLDVDDAGNSAYALTLTPSLSRLTKSTEHGVYRPRAVTASAADGSGVRTLLLRATDTMDEAWGWQVQFPGETAVRTVQVPSAPSPARTVTIASVPYPAAWLTELIDLTTPSGSATAGGVSPAGVGNIVDSKLATFLTDLQGNDRLTQYATNGYADLTELSDAALTAPVATPAGMYSRTTRFAAAAALTQTLPPAVPGRRLAVGLETGSATVTLAGAVQNSVQDVIGPAAATSLPLLLPGEVVVLHCTTAGRWRGTADLKPLAALDLRNDGRYATGRMAASDVLSTKSDGPLDGRARDDGALYGATGSVLPVSVGGVIGFPAAATTGNFYLLSRTPAPAPVVRIRGRFRFDASDSVTSGVCFGIWGAPYTALSPSTTPAPWHCSITPTYVRCSSFATGISVDEVVMQPVGYPDAQPRFHRSIPTDGVTWVTVEAIFDKAAGLAWLIVEWGGEIEVREFRHPNLSIDARYPFLQSNTVNAGDVIGRWDGDAWGWDWARPDERAPWADLHFLARAAAGRAVVGAGPITDRPGSRRSPGSTWTVRGQTLALAAAVAAPRTDQVATTAGSSTVTDASARTDSVSTTSGSPTVTDAAITTADQGRPVSGAGIPAGSFVGTVTQSTSFLLSSSATSQVSVNATANGSGVAAAIGLLSAADTGRLVTGPGIPAASYIASVAPGTSFVLSSSPTSAVPVAATATAATRSDTGCSTTAGSATVNDAAIVAGDVGKPVTGPGIPAGSFVGTVTAGTSFLLSSSASSQVGVNATATWSNVTVVVGGTAATIATDRITCASPVRAGTRVTIDTGAAVEQRVTGTPAGSGASYTLPLTSPLAFAHAAAAQFTIPSWMSYSDGTSWRDAAGIVVSGRLEPAVGHCLEDGAWGIVGTATQAIIRAATAPTPTKWRSTRVRRITAGAGTNASPQLFILYAGTVPFPRFAAEPGEPYRSVVLFGAQDAARVVTALLRFYNASGAQLAEYAGANATPAVGDPVLLPPASGVAPAGTVAADVLLYITAANGERFYMDAVTPVIAHGADTGPVRA